MSIYYKRRSAILSRLLGMLFFLASFYPVCWGQTGITISGPSPACVIAGTQYTFTVSGAYNGTYTFNWSTTGVFVGSSSGQGLLQVHIKWNSGTSGNVNLNMVGGGTTKFAPPFAVTIASAFTVGSITMGNQTIPYNTTPANILCSQPTGGSCGTPSYTYQWQQSTDNVNFTNISGATAQTLSFSSGLAATHYYRCLQTETNSGSSGYTNSVTVTVYPQLVPGSISPSSGTLNYNTSPGLLTLSGYSGGTGTDTLQWQSSPDNSSWSAITGATTANYTPGGLTALTYFRVMVESRSAAYSSTAVFTVNPEVIPGTISPSNISIPTGKIPGLLSATPATGGACGGSFAYQWQSSTDNINYTAITGATSLTYTPGALSVTTYYRLRVTCGTDIEYTAPAEVAIVTAQDISYVRVRDLHKPGVTDSLTAAGLSSSYDVSQTTQYFDGLGRVIQTVAMQQTPLQKDMVTFNMYDDYGRETNKYLPYADTSGSGNYKYSAPGDQYTFNAAQYPGEQFYFGQVNFEPSPLNRPLTTEAPGISWTGSGRGVSEQHLVNQTTDSVRIWSIAYPVGSIPTTSGTYPAGALYKELVTDEANHKVVSYKDVNGRVILKKVQLTGTPGSAHVGWLCTYYVYDDLNHLRFVIQPQAVVLINSNWSITTAIAAELCFRYEFDQHGHQIIKKIPGAGEAWMVYDIRDRLVMSQDSNLRALHKWGFDCYDALNRPDSSGLITDPTNYNNLSYHSNLALQSSAYPNVASYTSELMNRTFYDDYSAIGTTSGLPSAMATNYTSNSSIFITTLNSSPTYAVSITAHPITRGLATGIMTKVIGTTSQYLYAESFYDDRGRVVQTQSINYTGATDTLTNQYDFTGKPLRNLLSHKKSGNTAQAHTVVTKTDYDQSFRLRHIWKNIDGAATDQLIDSLQYNELGQLTAKYLGNNVDSLIYTYNIRGWLTGINPNYVAGTTSHYFGMELGYDKSTSLAPGTSYLTPQLTGNIEGTVWKTAGSGINRKYDFTYDSLSRLTGAAFLQNTSGASWDKNQVDYSVSGLNYDANGNILSMTQHGFTIGSSGAIDSLSYNYLASSNKLMGVTDAANNPTSQLGDFHYNTSTKQSTDYNYNGNGSLTHDNNKAIDSITYNFLNLPQLIHMKGKGNISYVYDATGNKLAKITIDSTASHSIRTLYLDGMVYQQTGTMASPGGATDTLQFISHEEGRARWAYHTYTIGINAYKLEYDFYEKDHLGNTRMVLTQEKDTTNYWASMEAHYRTIESQLFGNIASTCVAWTSMPNYQNIANNFRFGVWSPNDSVSKVDYTGTSGQTTGPSLLLKVMAGDTITPGVQCYYVSNTATTTNSSFTAVLNTLAAGIMGTPTGAAEGTLAGYTSSGSPVYSAVNTFLGAKDPAPPSGYPKAYLNWILLDDQFNYVSSASGSVATASTTYPAGQLNTISTGGPVVIPRNGYIYTWVSNETQGWDVFFDNFTVQYKQGPVLEENHYYPFGLAMTGISDHAFKTSYAQNKYRYNGKELQNQEFSDGTGLEEYDYGARFFDVQLGKFPSLDPASDKYTNWSPYSYCNNSPIIHIDPDGRTIDKASQDEWNKQKQIVIDQRNNLQSQVNAIISKAADEGWDVKTISAAIGDLNERIGCLNGTLTNLSTLENSTQVYALAQAKDGAGNTNYDPQTGKIVFSVGSTANFVHETTHGAQFESGDIAFNKENGLSFAQDVFDEQSAYRAQYAFDPSSISRLNSSSVANSFAGVTTNWVQNLTDANGQKPYAPGGSKNTGITNVNILSTRDQLIQSYPWSRNVLMQLDPNFKIKGTPGILYKN